MCIQYAIYTKDILEDYKVGTIRYIYTNNILEDYNVYTIHYIYNVFDEIRI